MRVPNLPDCSEVSLRLLSFSFVMLLAVLLLLLAAAVRPVHAAGVVGDGSAASCTEAALATALAGGGTVTFNCGSSPVTITVTSEQSIDADTTIDGGNRDNIIISGGGSTRVFAVAENTNLTVRNVTIANGSTTDNGGAILVERRSSTLVEHTLFSNNSAGNGGAIAAGGWNSTDEGGTLTVRDSTFSNNTATEDGGVAGGGEGGGAIYLKGGITGTVENSTFTGNQAANGGAIHLLGADLSVTGSSFESNIANHAFDNGGGGAIYVDGTRNHSGNITLVDSSFTNNTTNNLGGVIFSFPEGTGTTTIDGCVMDGNSATNKGLGGAIYHQSAHGNGPLMVRNSALVNNRSHSQGGALWSIDAPVTVINSTFVGNTALNPDPNPDPAWKAGSGGAITAADGVEIINSTIVGNSAGFVGGGVSGSGSNPNSPIIARNTIIASNTGGNEWGIQQNCTSNLVDGGNNIQFPQKQTSNWNDYECFEGQAAVDPLLEALPGSGPATERVLALQDNSPAIDAANPAHCPATDQRGVPRPVDGDGDSTAVCDIGAFEWTPAALMLTHMHPGMMGTDEAAAFTLTLRGSGFAENSVVRWNGADRPTTFVSTTRLTAAIEQADVATPGNVPVTVYNPDTGTETQPIVFHVVSSINRVYLPPVTR
jgi:predicted outer membrane repeat protein